jgi:hypothetical protein
MKQTINRKNRTGMFSVGGRPDRTKAPLIKTQPEVKPIAVEKITQPKPLEDSTPEFFNASIVSDSNLDGNSNIEIIPSGYLKRRKS